MARDICRAPAGALQISRKRGRHTKELSDRKLSACVVLLTTSGREKVKVTQNHTSTNTSVRRSKVFLYAESALAILLQYIWCNILCAVTS